MDDDSTRLASPRSYSHARPEAISKTQAQSPLMAGPAREVQVDKLSGARTHFVGRRYVVCQRRHFQTELRIA